MDREVITWRLKKLRKNEGLNQSELAEILGVKRNTVSTWERGTRVPDYSTLRKLVQLYEVSFDYLMGETDTEAIGEFECDDSKIKAEGKFPKWKDLFLVIPQLSKKSQDLLYQNIEFFLKAEGLL